MEANLDNSEFIGDDGDRIPCKSCGRRFLPEALEKHAGVCKKVFATKRKAFDSKKHRIIDGEHAMLLKNQEIQEKKRGKVVNKHTVKTGKWKKQSEEFRAVIKNKDGNTVIPSSISDDYTLCEYCNRKYNEQAYNKHLNFCKQKAINNSKKPKMNTSMKPNLNIKFKK